MSAPRQREASTSSASRSRRLPRPADAVPVRQSYPGSGTLYGRADGRRCVPRACPATAAVTSGGKEAVTTPGTRTARACRQALDGSTRAKISQPCKHCRFEGFFTRGTSVAWAACDVDCRPTSPSRFPGRSVTSPLKPIKGTSRERVVKRIDARLDRLHCRLAAH